MAERKKTWREIDKTKDRTSARPKKDKGSLERALEDPRLKRLYLAQAEKMFANTSDWKILKQNHGKDGFEDVALNLIGKQGLPLDWSDLLLLLDLKKTPEIVCDVMKNLMQTVSNASISEKNAFRTKLKILSLTSEDIAVKEEALACLEAF